MMHHLKDHWPDYALQAMITVTIVFAAVVALSLPH